MYIQRFYKGIRSTDAALHEQIFAHGLLANALLNAPATPFDQLTQRLTELNLYNHVLDYATHGHDSPFISLTAGVRAAGKHDWVRFGAWETAVRFATGRRVEEGAVVEGWVVCLGTPAWHVVGSAEDIRDTLIYPTFNRFWRQGEVTAKLQVPGLQIERCTYLKANGSPREELVNPDFVDPALFSNVRDITEV